ncbi:MAG TPA: pyridoxamine 5'-phosphate oxidase family protein [Acidimicrobiales bacterium]|nr:pyridoxamine 5'-phosphate oxidase family protein [Acidimicrobiales bacterium]
MGSLENGISDELTAWLLKQPVFFVTTAPLDANGHVNCSPKGNRSEFAVLSEMSVAYLDQTGSGVETIAHLRENGRITIMFCAFTGAPRIVRLQGRGEFVLRSDKRFEHLARNFTNSVGVGARAIIIAHLDRVADSCGYGVPLMEFKSHRPALDAWSIKQGESGIALYKEKNNRFSIDDLDGI